MTAISKKLNLTYVIIVRYPQLFGICVVAITSREARSRQAPGRIKPYPAMITRAGFLH